MIRDHCSPEKHSPAYACGPIEEIRIPQPTRDTCVPKELRIKDIKIRQLDHGYVLNVGCKEIALSSIDQVIFGLRKYLKDPYKTQELFEKGEFKFEK